MAYDPTAAGDAAFNPSTDTAKCYANYPRNVSGGTTGHRITQSIGGRQVQVTTDDMKTNPVVGSSYIYMLKHPQ